MKHYYKVWDEAHPMLTDGNPMFECTISAPFEIVTYKEFESALVYCEPVLSEFLLNRGKKYELVSISPLRYCYESVYDWLLRTYTNFKWAINDNVLEVAYRAEDKIKNFFKKKS